MRIKSLGLAAVFFLTLSVCGSTHAQVAGHIESMKLLTTDIGWAATRNKLFWTTDGGASWKDITPNTARGRTITSATFSDQSHGWVLLAHRRGDDPQTGFGKSLFELARTADAGTSWSVKELTVPNPDPNRGFSEQTWLDFVDALHGWALLRANGNTAMGGGVLATTDDGGGVMESAGRPCGGSDPFRHGYGRLVRRGSQWRGWAGLICNQKRRERLGIRLPKPTSKLRGEGVPHL